ncbi:photosystem II reaction center PsbP family protein [Wolffia australiana]
MVMRVAAAISAPRAAADEEFPSLAGGFRRRFLAGTTAAAALALGANFAGVTSSVLGFYPDLGRRLKLDAIYPIAGYSRCLDTDEGFEFIYPADWVGDQTLLYRAAERAELLRRQDPSAPLMAAPPRRRLRPGGAREPAVAFGPPGSSGELNVSVIVSSVPTDFSIEAFGGPEEVGQAVLKTITAGRGVTATLVNAMARRDDAGKVNLYRIEFTVESPSFCRHNLAVCCSYGGKLFTLNAQAPESAWDATRDRFSAVADSFHLLIR